MGYVIVSVRCVFIIRKDNTPLSHLPFVNPQKANIYIPIGIYLKVYEK